MRSARALLAASALVMVTFSAAAQVRHAPAPPQLPPPDATDEPQPVTPVPPSDPVDDEPAPMAAPPTPPPVAAPAPLSKRAGGAKKEHVDMGVLAAHIGIRGMLQQVNGSDHDGTIGGAGLGAWLFMNFGLGALAARVEFQSRIGGGGAGADGQYGADLSFGPRLPLGEHVALIGRLGASGRVLGNGRLSWWTLSLPELDAGLHTAAGPVFFEATGLAGVTLGGNYLVGDDGQRKIGTAPHLGARATIGVGPFVAAASWRRIFEGQYPPATPLDSLEGNACIVFGKIVGAAACLDGRILSGTVRYPGGTFHEATALYGGLSISIGAVAAGPGKGSSLKKK